ncbi:hypothetical protein E2562_033708 [Oryza meyeriana var. granulata]|uniref:rRNA N-glycosylase n=1 Tax=Oryza meyeriana var. granulata TaxID=110450 RepID=A0A6G1DSP1_9ORYZ|nr:hypothetical protein E2562_033708 [Oryza meyeriana var. granulata]
METVNDGWESEARVAAKHLPYIEHWDTMSFELVRWNRTGAWDGPFTGVLRRSANTHSARRRSPLPAIADATNVNKSHHGQRDYRQPSHRSRAALASGNKIAAHLPNHSTARPHQAGHKIVAIVANRATGFRWSHAFLAMDALFFFLLLLLLLPLAGNRPAVVLGELQIEEIPRGNLIMVDLQDYGSGVGTLAMRDDTLYVAGFANRSGHWHALRGSEHLLRDRATTPLPFGNSYGDLVEGVKR